MKILVVDDEKLLVKGMKFNLENEGYEVVTAYDGASAVELAKKGDIDLIVMDVMMPGLSGTDACMQIREFSNVPVIMLTARSEDSDKLMGFAYGADDYVTKPFNILELKARIRALLRRAAGNGQQAQAYIHRSVIPGVGIAPHQIHQALPAVYPPGVLHQKLDQVVFLGRQVDGLSVPYGHPLLRVQTQIAHPAAPVHIMTKWGVGYYFAGEEQPTA